MHTCTCRYDLEDTILFLRRPKTLDPAEVATLFRVMTATALAKPLARTNSEVSL